MDNENNPTSLRVASFSCYLDTSAETNFVHNIKRAMEDPVPNKSAISNSPRVASFAHYLDTAKENFAFPGPQKNLEKPKSKKDGEIDIFGADKYFNMRLDDEAEQKHEYYKVQKSTFTTRTPSVYSEASSWNSQTGLLRNRLPGNVVPQGKPKKALGWRLIASLACHGPCLDRKSVFVQGSIDQGLVQGSRLNDGFVTHGRNSRPGNLTVKTGPEVVNVEDPRVSIEVFGQKKGVVIPPNLERKVSTLTWDAIPKAPGINSSTTVCDDMASDASSDLFEIENISGSGYGLLSAQDQADNMSSCMSPTTEHYAPSEASIEWSVVTASAMEYSSVVSDYEERSVSMAGDFISRGETKPDKFTKSAVGGKGAPPKGRPGGLLGCNSQKALGVADNVHKIPAKLQASAKVKDIESLQSQHAFTARRRPPSLLN